MTQQVNPDLLMTQKFLEVICKQHDAFKFQTGAFLDTVFDFSKSLPKIDEFKTTIKDIYALLIKISNLLENAKGKFQSEIKQKGNFNEASLLSQIESDQEKHQKFIINPKFRPEKLKDQIFEKSNQEIKKGFQKIFNEDQNHLLTFQKKNSEENIQQNNIFGLEEIFKGFYDKKRETANSVFESDIFGLKEEDSRRFFIEDEQKERIPLTYSEIGENLFVDENTFFSNSKQFSPKKVNKKSDLNAIKDNSQEFLALFAEEKKQKSLETFSKLAKKEIPDEQISDKKQNPEFNFSAAQTRLKKFQIQKQGKKISKTKRGQYQICPMEIKNEAIRIARIHNAKEASEILNIPEKNIKRWLKNGPERKKGAGRKTMDPSMEKKLLDWIVEEFKKCRAFPDCKDIKFQAKNLSSHKDFKASKGWCDKFMRRNLDLFELLLKKGTDDLNKK